MTTSRKATKMSELEDISKPSQLRSDTPARVRVIPLEEGTADTLATRLLLDAYSDDGGFHCPVCHITITEPNEAVEHLAEEVNAAMLKLTLPSGTPPSSGKKGVK
jgi:hypothetical protein